MSDPRLNAVTEREKQLEAAYRHLFEIVAIALAGKILCEMECDDIFEKELAEIYREQQGMLIDPSAHFSALRERMRSSVHFERARLRLKEHMADWIATQKKEAAAA